jgi:peptidoglycan/LPS O-acetylase OafA/YrhL
MAAMIRAARAPIMHLVSAIAAFAATHLLPLAQATTFSDLMPYLAVMALGFLVGAWGGQMRSPLAIAIGITLIMLAVALFVLANSSGDSGLPPV